jgi:hypothetical protein
MFLIVILLSGVSEPQVEEHEGRSTLAAKTTVNQE